jgi:uncharacterized protein YprB with RNaseH-like and TPR domain
MNTQHRVVLQLGRWEVEKQLTIKCLQVTKCQTEPLILEALVNMNVNLRVSYNAGNFLNRTAHKVMYHVETLSC